MGGLLRSPAPPPPAPPPPGPDPEEERRRQRQEILRRRRRGRAGTIATSPRGLLEPRDPADNGKSLLGE